MESSLQPLAEKEKLAGFLFMDVHAIPRDCSSEHKPITTHARVRPEDAHTRPHPAWRLTQALTSARSGRRRPLDAFEGPFPGCLARAKCQPVSVDYLALFFARKDSGAVGSPQALERRMRSPASFFSAGTAIFQVKARAWLPLPAVSPLAPQAPRAASAGLGRGRDLRRGWAREKRGRGPWVT
ncbi:unnamed protein product [Rangifer tarandus platyrhynchus]|uniref:Uncharacterized protein n=1 Tax=Rangifer tarandus platyrhynchus TaxID=3082113 RepID=A0AC60A5L2_RANTA